MVGQPSQRPAAGHRAARRLTAGGFAVLAALVIPALPGAYAAAATSPAAPGQQATDFLPVAAAASGVTLRGWGRNDHGQLGDATQNQRLAPVTVKLPPGVTISSVRAGCIHTLALTSTGKMLAWGDNSFGELGDNLVVPFSTTPVTVKLPPGTKVTAIRAGCGFSLALTSTGQVLSWGINDFGQTGDGTMGSDDVNKPAPVDLPANTQVKVISAGFSHSLAVTTDGKVLSWGENSDGELGDGTKTSSGMPAAVTLPVGTTPTGVAAGEFHSLVLTSTGQVLAWGANDNGQLGTGNTTASTTPVSTQLPTGTKVKSLFAGCFDSLALTSAGKVLGWGLNDDGEVGDGTTVERHRPTAAKLPAGTTVTAVSSGCRHNLALTSTGKVLAWGNGERGELGVGFTTDQDRPAPVKLPANLTATAIASGPSTEASFATVHPAAPPAT
jgi:alpha-tubulin suppressor-like RCC1 family protein